ncbi:AlpA family phage regulatory protein [uncultured Nitratireductor sp.]|uniref:helix-turn-helix transcriptional regulator n=1 Tax=uncultured Nitratireductor sp. TaxID=520953 RepID=UPI0026182D32|nr:AlpA family phage regulatory protein [uncultured Nitratireductor sp.]
MKLKLLHRNEVQDRLGGITHPTFYRLMETEGFPRPVKVSPRRIAFVESEIEEWIETQVAARDAA